MHNPRNFILKIHIKTRHRDRIGMLNTISDKVSDFFKQLTTLEFTEKTSTISIEIACAVLLCEVMRADNHFDKAEQLTVKELMLTHFTLSKDEVEQTIQQAKLNSEESNDIYTYTTIINQEFNIDEKIILVKSLWQLALADGEIAPIEQHIIRKIADLLHLRHSEYISTKPKI